MRTTILAALAVLMGCAVHPAGERTERERAEQVGRSFEREAAPPPLPEAPTLDDYLAQAFFSNAALRQRYLEWRAALEQIPQDASPPNVALSFSFMFAKERMKRWDRTTLGIANEPMANIPFPSKLSAAGERALSEARTAGLRFEAQKFALQRDVIWTWDDLALLAETLRIRRARLDLERVALQSASERVRSGSGMPSEVLRMQNEIAMAANEIATLESRVPGLAARLNALVGRDADAPVRLPDAVPAPRPLTVNETDLLRLAAERSPELHAMAQEVETRRHDLDLAQQGYIPDFGLNASLTGDITRTLGAMLVLPTRVEAIDAAIEQARFNQRAAEQAQLQYERDLVASFVASIHVVRNSTRAMELFAGMIVPNARQLVDAARASYVQGRGMYAEVLDAQRMLLEAQLTIAELAVTRDKAIAAIESWTAVDIETLGAMP